ncbi:gamma-aminobutyric acid type B receptor subunit 1-like isoform X2 [Varroa jacobsoni]|uniref:gamma-aminobutyric acid type B receptor subunit 1-like isoform X2 n=1 Tax=Varroa jacobsoni TaxID=62625 RepID=UPI000BF9817A|nr:gamma-aminobutyric acid type B receptor subunit 1-like isoform X2 [Varroa jacobsoni]
MRWLLVVLAMVVTGHGNAAHHGHAHHRAIHRRAREPKELHLAAVFPMQGHGGWLGGQGCLPAALMALEDVNNRTDLLPGYRLRLHWRDSQCNPGKAASEMYDLIYDFPTKLMMLGGCSIVSSTIGEAAKMWNLIVVSYGSSSPALSNRKRFPTFFRTHPSATIHNPTRIKLFNMFEWSRIAIIQEAEEVFTSTGVDLEARCKEANIEVVSRVNFITDPTDAVKTLKRQDARIIVGMFYVAAARRVFCEAFRQKIFGKQYVWLLIGWYEDDWYTIQDKGHNCTTEELKQALEGHITTEALMLYKEENKTISGMTSKTFMDRYIQTLEKDNNTNGRRPEGFQEAPLAYDAIWAVALALNKTIARLRQRGELIENFTYTNKRIMSELWKAMNATQFLGVSGYVSFSAKGDRMAQTQIEQMINGTYYKIGYYDYPTDDYQKTNFEPQWIDGKPPQDRTIIKTTLRTVSLGLYAGMTSVALLGILWAVGLLIFNWVFRHSRYIAWSHPSCNNILLFGVIVCLFSVALLGLDGQFVDATVYWHICQARAWLLANGFSLAFGSMFSKIWRVHRLATKAKTESKAEIQKIKSWKLYSVVGILLAIDAIILISWSVIDPMQRKIQVFPHEDPPGDVDEDVKIQPELELCVSEHHNIWLGVMYSYKGLVLLFGIFLAYETRSVKIKVLNDSRLVGMSIYNVVILCLITTPVTLVIGSQQDACFAFVALAIIFCSYISMTLVFIPKITELVRRPRERQDCRSLIDNASSREEEERLRRLQIENEALKKQIQEKEDQIEAIKKKLADRAKTASQVHPAPTKEPVRTTAGMPLRVLSAATTNAGILLCSKRFWRQPLASRNIASDHPPCYRQYCSRTATSFGNWWRKHRPACHAVHNSRSKNVSTCFANS